MPVEIRSRWKIEYRYGLHVLACVASQLAAFDIHGRDASVGMISVSVHMYGVCGISGGLPWRQGKRESR